MCADPVLAETLVGFDIPEGLRRLQGNRSLYRKLILKFADSCRSGIEQINVAIASNKFQEILQVSHSIKGSAGNLAAKDLESAALALENSVRNDANSSPLIDTVKAEFDNLKRVADKMFKVLESLGGAEVKTTNEDGDVTAGIPKEHYLFLAQELRMPLKSVI